MGNVSEGGGQGTNVTSLPFPLVRVVVKVFPKLMGWKSS